MAEYIACTQSSNRDVPVGKPFKVVASYGTMDRIESEKGWRLWASKIGQRWMGCSGWHPVPAPCIPNVATGPEKFLRIVK